MTTGDERSVAARDAREEYLDATNKIRHYGTLRFAELTIYIAITAGLLITILFWMLQERTMLYWYHFTSRAVEFEKDLGFKQYSTRPRAGLVTGQNTVRTLFLVMAVFWTVALVLLP